MDFKDNIFKLAERIKVQREGMDIIEATLVEHDECVETTKEKIKAYIVISGILRKNIDADKIIYKDFKNYFIISAYEQIRWMCRLHFEYGKKSIVFPIKDYKGEIMIEIKSIDDIFNYSDLLLESLETAKKSYLKCNKE